MFEVRVHGRGGQGVVTAAELLSVAAFAEGAHAQAFPSFGSERTGAPVVAFCRIDDRPIRTREPITRPDALIVQDPTLLHQPGVFDGLAEGGYLLINSSREPAQLGIDDQLARCCRERVVVVPATELAVELVGRPVPNAALLGGFAAVTGVVTVEAVVAAIRERFTGRVADGNAAAARRAFDYVSAEIEEYRHVAAG